MSYKSLSQFVQALEAAGELVRITEFVSPRLEITEVADRMVKNGGKALLFENTGTDFPLLINLFASDKRICMALGVNNLQDIEDDLDIDEWAAFKIAEIRDFKLSYAGTSGITEEIYNVPLRPAFTKPPPP